MERGLRHFAVKAAIAASISLFVLSLLLIAWYGIDVLVLMFLGVLVAALLMGISEWLASALKISPRWALGLLLFFGVVAAVLGGWLIGASVAGQFGELMQRLPQAAGKLRATIEQQPWGPNLIGSLPKAQDTPVSLSRITGIAGGAFGAVGSLLVVFFIGVFIAYEPDTYRRGLLDLLPPKRRPRGEQILDKVGRTLRGWLIAKALSMAVVGMLTWLGLLALGIPLALPLAIITAFLSFIPNIGPVLSLIPAGLIALAEGPASALYVVALFIGIQTVETYLITPILQRDLISLPPATIIFAQVLLGVLVGWAGVLIATPLAAVAMVVVNMLYREDLLGERTGE